jgi:hypothetical protein
MIKLAKNTEDSSKQSKVFVTILFKANISPKKIEIVSCLLIIGIKHKN